MLIHVLCVGLPKDGFSLYSGHMYTMLIKVTEVEVLASAIVAVVLVLLIRVEWADCL